MIRSHQVVVKTAFADNKAMLLSNLCDVFSWAFWVPTNTNYVEPPDAIDVNEKFSASLQG